MPSEGEKPCDAHRGENFSAGGCVGVVTGIRRGCVGVESVWCGCASQCGGVCHVMLRLLGVMVTLVTAVSVSLR